MAMTDMKMRRLPPLGRGGVGVALACGSALWLLGSHEARALGPSESAGGITLEVRVDPEISGADDLVTWANEAGRNALSDRSSAERSGSVRVTIAGGLYDYEVTLTALQGDEPVGQSSMWDCECSNDELLTRLRKEIPRTADRLIIQKPAPASEPRAAPQVDAIQVDAIQVGDIGRTPRKKLSTAGAVGVALMMVGVASVGTGATLMALNLGLPQGAGEWRDRRDFFNPGVYGTVVGSRSQKRGLVSARAPSKVRREC